ncbi:ankyrin repeat domain-containing protein [Paenibacillus terrigena]|uniref:ankyrin repeat domain-containing protein n=1 Tax=Paenibacillus terrigena TaxID=369333 RepID=UPI003CCBB85A
MVLRIILMYCGFFMLTACQQPDNSMTKDVARMNNQLILAAEQGNTEAVLQWLEQGANIDARDSQGRTAILAATHRNHPETVQALIEAGANIHIQDNQLDNPFLYAGAEGLLDIVKLLIDAGADPAITNRYGGVALIPASEHGYVEVVRELLTRTSIDVNHVNNLGWTALLEAIILNNGGPKQQQVIQLLIEHGADVTIPDKNGVTPLDHAKNRHFTEIERLLVEAQK